MSISQTRINSLFNIPTEFKIFSGKYPEKYSHISELNQETKEMIRNKIIPDKAKSKINRLRKDHPLELIELNEKEKDMLINNSFQLPKKKISFDKSKIILTKQFVLDIKADAIVNTANEALMGGGGMDLLIHKYAGESLKKETESLPNVMEGNYYYGVKCLTGDAKITSGHNLPFKYIVHVVTPYLLNDGTTDKINHIKSYQSVLNYIDGKNIRSMVIGPISTGYYGYPMVEATLLGINTIIDFMNIYTDNVDNIYLWVYNDIQYEIFEYILKNI
jgi:O-acetyl-ADP-ribose deacetylase (regulator of RNase III)